MKDGWIGVDLDGTLAVDEDRPWEEMEHRIGLPVPAMLERVKRWLEEGREVRIMTARVAPVVGEAQEVDALETYDSIQQHRLIEKWCIEHVGHTLPITACKDWMMAELWDDRAVQVVKNTGERVGDVERTKRDSVVEQWPEAGASGGSSPWERGER